MDDLVVTFRRSPATAENIKIFMEDHEFDYDYDELQEFINRFAKFVNVLPK